MHHRDVRIPAIRWGGVLLAWTLLLLLFATQYYVTLRTSGQPVTWMSQVRRELPGWALWALLTPLVFAAAERFPLVGRNGWRNGLLHLPIGGGLFALYLLLYTLVVRYTPIRPDLMRAELSFVELMWQGLLLNFAFFALVYVGVIALHQAFALQRANQRRALEASRLESHLTQARLDALRRQLQPHFLFNTLHGVSALVTRDPRAARKMLTCLSDLLRASIDASDELVPLERELEILERYLEVQRLRFGDRLHVDVEASEACRTWQVPRFLLQPLVENAIEHGSRRQAEGGRVRVRVACDGGQLSVVVRDDGPGFPEDVREGVGLRNTRSRLEALYGPSFSFRLENDPGGGAYVEVRLPAAPRHRGDDA